MLTWVVLIYKKANTTVAIYEVYLYSRCLDNFVTLAAWREICMFFARSFSISACFPPFCTFPPVSRRDSVRTDASLLSTFGNGLWIRNFNVRNCLVRCVLISTPLVNLIGKFLNEKESVFWCFVTTFSVCRGLFQNNATRNCRGMFC